MLVQGEGAERVKVSVRTMVQHQADSDDHSDSQDSEQVGSNPLFASIPKTAGLLDVLFCC